MFARTQTRFHDVRIRLENYTPQSAAEPLSNPRCDAATVAAGETF
jgi:hypothetical protein